MCIIGFARVKARHVLTVVFKFENVMTWRTD